MGFFQEIKHQYGPEQETLFKTWATYSNKLTSFANRKIFLLKCRQYNIFPNHVIHNFKCLYASLIGKHPYSNEINKLIKTFQKDTLNTEIKITFWYCNFYKSSISNIITNLKQSVPENIVNEFARKQSISYEIKFKKLKLKQQNKLIKLLADQHNYTMKNCEKFIINLTDVNVPLNIKQLLGMGPKFSVDLEKNEVPVLDILKDTEYCIQQSNTDLNKDELRLACNNIITNYLHNPQKNDYQSNIIKDHFIKAKKFLKSHPNIFITRSDKGNVSVIMDKNEYKNKMNSLLNETNVYQKIDYDPTNRYQTQCNNMVNKLRDKQFIDEDKCKRHKNYNCKPPRIYGLIKVHKHNNLRPVVPCIQSPSYKISELLTEILSNLKSTFSYNIKNSYELVDIVTNITLPPDYVLISLDVVNLFTNIPKSLVVNIIKERWPIISTYTTVSLEIFIEMVNLSFETSYFCFDNTFYKQTDGTAMGSPASPILANIVMEDLVEKVIKIIPFNIPFLKIYVDDTIMAVPSKQCNNIQNYFNSYHNNIQFTIEKEQDKSIAFLDVKLIRTDNQSIITDWYEKDINSGRLLNYCSSHPLKQKLSIMHATKNKIIKLSNQKFVNKNLLEFRNKLINNNYPPSLCNLIINTNNVRAQKGPNSETKKYLKIPYIKGCSEKLKRILTNENTTIVYYYKKTLGKLFNSMKDPLKLEYSSEIVYKIPCKNCNKSYIGQTKQNLKNRINEHKYSCNDKYKHKKEQTALATHHFDDEHEFDFDNVSILDKENNYKKRLISEMMCIQAHNKSSSVVNKKTDVAKLSIVYKYIIHNFIKFKN